MRQKILFTERRVLVSTNSNPELVLIISAPSLYSWTRRTVGSRTVTIIVTTLLVTLVGRSIYRSDKLYAEKCLEEFLLTATWSHHTIRGQKTVSGGSSEVCG